MQARLLLMFGLALACGSGAVFVAQQWAKSQIPMEQPLAAAPAAPPSSTIVVAASPLRYGTELTESNLREIRWPNEAVPEGAFRTVAELLGETRRVALGPIEPNEAILRAKVTGPGQRGTLSTLLEEGMGAVTISVNEVIGVSGFVLPGDRVDVLLTRQPRGGDGPAAAQPSTYNDVVLQNVRVLAVGQLADERTDKPSLVSAVTVEVDPVAAQKIALAQSAGSLSLMLRKAGDQAARPGRRVAASEIGQATVAGDDRTTTVRVTRAMKRDDYTVPVAQPRTFDTQPRFAAR